EAPHGAATWDVGAEVAVERKRLKDIVAVARDDHAERDLPVVRRVRRIQGPASCVDPDLAANRARQGRFEPASVDVSRSLQRLQANSSINQKPLARAAFFDFQRPRTPTRGGLDRWNS